MKKIIKVSLSILAIASIVIAVPQLILAYPAFLFEEEFHYKNVTILSDKKIGVDMKETLDTISTRLLNSG